MGRIRTQKKMKMRHNFTLFNFNNLAAIFTADNYGALAHNLYMDLSSQCNACPPDQMPQLCRLEVERPPSSHPSHPSHPSPSLT